MEGRNNGMGRTGLDWTGVENSGNTMRFFSLYFMKWLCFFPILALEHPLLLAPVFV
jgi:hypothetical protein